MRKGFLTAGIVLALAAIATAAFAGDYHRNLNLTCSDCHVMHFSQSHGYSPDGTGVTTPLDNTNGPFHYLLRDDVNDLCLSCHNGVSGPDVFETHGAGYVRQAGALNELGGNGLYPEFTGHTLGSTAVAPGSDPAWSNPDGLNCANCHAVHGSNSVGKNSYRNLGGFGTQAGSSWYLSYTSTPVDGANPLTAWIHEDSNGGVNAQHYGIDGITFNELQPDSSDYAEFCKACHTDFHGDVGGAEVGGMGGEEFERHPNAGANIGAVGGGHSRLSTFTGMTNQVQVLSPNGQKAMSLTGYDGTDTGLTPSCMSCHKGHGNQNAFGLIYMKGTGTVTEQGDSGTGARNLCKQCHGQGGSS